MSMIVDSAQVEGLHRCKQLAQDFKTIATANQVTTLVTTDESVIGFTGSTVGQVLRLPAATTLTAGFVYCIESTATVSVTIQDSAATVLAVIEPNQGGTFRLNDNTTTAGVWFVKSRATAVPVAVGSANAQGVSQAFARADHVHESFTPKTFVSDTANFTTTSTTDVLVTTMTATPGAGTYVVMFSCNSAINAANRSVTFSVYANNVLAADSLRVTWITQSNQQHGSQTQAVVQVAAGQVIEIRAKVSSSTLTVSQRSMILMRTGP